MDRRHFLIKSATFLAGSLVGCNGLSKALALDQSPNISPLSPCVALIIDDIGYNLDRAHQFLKLQVPITYAILPRLPKTHTLAREIHGEGHEIMLHQPMEPFNATLNPGPGALYVGDDANRITNTLMENISDVPFAVGVNNHMGSRFTSRKKEMKQTLGVIKEKDLFFVDSLTTSRSTAYQTARHLHIGTACRNIFLDNKTEEGAIFSKLMQLKKHALKYGNAIGIGHPHTNTARAISRFINDHMDAKLSLVYVSFLIPHA